MVAIVETVSDKGLPDMPAYVGGAIMRSWTSRLGHKGRKVCAQHGRVH